MSQIEPGMYNEGIYGIRLKNVLEVYDTGDRHPSGARFMGFRDVSLVPSDPKLIDRGLLSLQEVTFEIIQSSNVQTHLNRNLI